jgi:putative tricarboxylic transport membrane protein
MRAPQTAVGAGTLVLGALIAFGATRISADAGYSGVGPNFLPLLVGALLTVCGGFLLWEAGSGGFREMEEPSGAARGDWPAVLWVSAGILLNAALITRIGFVLSCVLCFVLAVRGFKASQGRLDLSPRAWVTDVLIGFAIAAPVYWMFGKLLAISLPGISSSGWI